MSPDWLGSPQHPVAGLLLAIATVLVLHRRVGPWPLLGSLAIGVVATAELLVEVAEFWLLYDGTASASAYVDTVSDLASTLVGGVAGTVLALAAVRGRGRA